MSFFIRINVVFLLFLLVVFIGKTAKNEDLPVFELKLKNHQFEPKELIIPAGKKVRLVIKNLDSTVEEFESFDLKREKIVPANGEVRVVVGPLQPGEYKFFGEFHEHTARGVVKVEK